MAPKIATYSRKHNSVAEAFNTNKFRTYKGQIYVQEPPRDSNHMSSWCSELLIPYKAMGVTYAFFGPLPRQETVPSRLEKIFPIYEHSTPRVCIDRGFNLKCLLSDSRCKTLSFN